MAIALVAQYATPFTSATTPQTVSPTVDPGDVLVIIGFNPNNNVTLNTPTGGSLTYTLQTSITANVGRANLYLWTAPATSAQSFTLSGSASSSSTVWGFAAFRYRGVSGIGAANSGGASDTAPSVNLTTTVPNALIVMGVTDNEAAATTSVYRTGAGAFTQNVAHQQAGSCTKWMGHHADAGVVGSKTLGMTTPTAPDWSLVAVELKPASDPPFRRRPNLGALIQL